MTAPLRGTQSLVGQMGWVFHRPSLVAIEIGWRWLFGIPFLAVCWIEMQRILADVPPAVMLELLRSLVLLLAPFAPHLVAELWEELGEESSVLRAPWPVSDAELAKEDELEVPVQINGKLVSVIRVPAEADSKTIEAAALADEKIQARIAGKTVVKVIVVPRKLVNLVVK